MTTLLIKRNNEWFLAAFAPHLRGCNLSTNQKPRLGANKFHLWHEQIWVQSEAPLDGVTFYPELRYKGLPVTPIAWSAESTEPILRVHSMPDAYAVETSSYFPGGPTMKEILAAEHRDRDLWRRLLREREAAALRVHRAMLEDGWEQAGKSEWQRWCHVDELEKSEGPPPAGPF